MALGIFPIVSCFALLPLAAVIAFVVFLVFWMRQKTSRDEMVLNLLDGINTEIEEIGKMMTKKAE